MTKPNEAERVDAYLAKHPEWQTLLANIRSVLLRTDLEETIKWGGPAYTLEGRVLIGLAAFKAHCAIWFHQGVYLKDESRVLQNAQETTRGMRQWRFTQESKLNKRLLASYVRETIANERAGKRISPQRRKTLKLPDELAAALKRDKALESAYTALTPGKQREYAEHIGSAKREATRASRLEKAIPQIKAGQGLHDKYRPA